MPQLLLLLQDGRDFADVVSPKMSIIFGMAAENRFYLRVIQHLVEGDTRTTGPLGKVVCLISIITIIVDVLPLA